MSTKAQQIGELIKADPYQTYAQHADWKDYLGQPLPTFDDMRDNTKAHWMHVAEALALYGARQETNAQRIAETARQ